MKKRTKNQKNILTPSPGVLFQKYSDRFYISSDPQAGV